MRKANEELESFTYTASHDLRAPLRGINGFSKALLEDYGQRLDEVARGYLERISTGAVRMGELIATCSASPASPIRQQQRAYFVRYNGVGFDMAYLNKLFVPFQRLHRAGRNIARLKFRFGPEAPTTARLLLGNGSGLASRTERIVGEGQLPRVWLTKHRQTIGKGRRPRAGLFSFGGSAAPVRQIIGQAEACE